MKNKIINIILAVAFITGLSLLLYPTLSNEYNKRHQSQAIKNYEQSVGELDTTDIEEALKEAEEYNAKLASKTQTFNLNDEEEAEYESQLSIADGGVMSVVTIEKIDVSLPVYHGTSETVLNSACGHLAGSSLPVGGESTHAVLTGHRGLPSAKLFTDLDQLSEGDTFTVTTLGRKMIYQIDDIRIVLPSEISSLKIEEGKDLCTLVTCTPYGVNSHRLLVTGHRISEEEAKKITITADAIKIDPLLITPVIAVILILLLVVGLGISKKNNKAVKQKKSEKLAEIIEEETKPKDDNS